MRMQSTKREHNSTETKDFSVLYMFNNGKLLSYKLIQIDKPTEIQGIVLYVHKARQSLIHICTLPVIIVYK